MTMKSEICRALPISRHCRRIYLLVGDVLRFKRWIEEIKILNVLQECCWLRNILENTHKVKRILSCSIVANDPAGRSVTVENKMMS